MSEITYLSIFSGIEAASVAFEPLGWKPLAFCEIDPFPSAILARNYPDVVNLGDIRQVASDDGTTPTLTNSDSHVPAVAFAQNQRDEVRLIGGDGQTAGALTAQRWGNHKNETLLLEPVVMASGQAHAEISRGGVAPTIAARNYKDPPLLFEQPNQ